MSHRNRDSLRNVVDLVSSCTKFEMLLCHFCEGRIRSAIYKGRMLKMLALSKNAYFMIERLCQNKGNNYISKDQIDPFS